MTATGSSRGLVNAHSHGRGLGWFRLGAPDDALEPWICQILAQPGLDPYLDTLARDHDLGRATVAALEPSLDNGMVLQVVVQLMTEIGDLFEEAHKRLAKEALRDAAHPGAP